MTKTRGNFDRPFDLWASRILHAVEVLIGVAVALKRGSPEERAGSRKAVRELAHMYETMCDEIELPSASQLFGFIRDDLDALRPLTDEQLADRVDQAARSLRADLDKRYFFRVVDNKQSYFGADFGPEVTKAFPSAADDVREANTCYALERYAASIFHAMRAVEVALRALAIERGVTVGKGPLAWQEWNGIITAIDDAVDGEASKWTKGPEKDAFQEFYRGALSEFQGFRVLYRNHVMHTRPKKAYGDRDAIDAVDSVGRFLTRLSVRLTEKGRRIRWKKS